MTREQFISILNRLKKQDDNDHAFSEHIGLAFPGCHSPIYDNNELWLAVIEALSISLNDKYEYINWWIYETQFGKNDLGVYDNDGEEHFLHNPGELYDYLQTKQSKE